ncbi:MAG: aldo/keto reductase [Pseudomonadales bacterium]|nr:aldo/keto reductase [Pseudomonadales bacterium]
MNFINRIPGTDIDVSALGLGTVKIGRNQGVKYPTAFDIPDDRTLRNLLALAADLGVNLLDTAPAYGNSEERLGKLLRSRQDWVIATKVGEAFIDGSSVFDFGFEPTLMSVERSLKRLNSDYLDIVLIHSDGMMETALADSPCLEALRICQQKGLVKAIGLSAKTEAGGIAAARHMDLVMLTYNPQQQDIRALEQARQQHKGVLVKKGLMSGHLDTAGHDPHDPDPIAQCLRFVFREPGINSLVAGTINPAHLQHNVETLRRILKEPPDNPAPPITPA